MLPAESKGTYVSLSQWQSMDEATCPSPWLKFCDMPQMTELLVTSLWLQSLEFFKVYLPSSVIQILTKECRGFASYYTWSQIPQRKDYNYHCILIDSCIFLLHMSHLTISCLISSVSLSLYRRSTPQGLEPCLSCVLLLYPCALLYV